MTKAALLLLVVAAKAWAGLAATCDPTQCGEDSICDVGCVDDPTKSFLDSRGCDLVTLCRECDEDESSDTGSSDEDLYSCREVVMNNLIRSFELLALDTVNPFPVGFPITASETEDLVRPIAEQTFLPNSEYTILGAAKYTGYEEQTEYLIAPFPSGNFMQYFFSKSTIDSITEISEGVYVVENAIEATYYTYDAAGLPNGVGGPILGNQVFTFTFPHGEVKTSITTVALDFAFVQALGQKIRQSDLSTLCRAILGICDEQAEIPTGYGADIGFTLANLAACISRLESLTDTQSLDGDSVPCRQLHLILAQERPDIHCAHVAKASTKCN